MILLNSDAGGNEHPITTAFVEWYSANVHPVVKVQAIIADLGSCGSKAGATKERRNEFAEDDVLTFDRLAYVKDIFPSRRKQFCTTHLKLWPQHRWMKKNLAGVEWKRYSGVRREESMNRRGRQPSELDEFFGCPLELVIVDWTKQMCFDYVKYHGEQYNELYTLGFDRVGCAPCVNADKDSILAWHQRFPECLDKVRGWERKVGKTFFMPIVPGLEINWIDDVIKWAKTVHGGKQMGLHVLYERPACESDYGLCE